MVLGEHVQLPYRDVLQWSEAALVVPKPAGHRGPLPAAEPRTATCWPCGAQGRFLWETHHHTDSIFSTVLAVILTPSILCRSHPGGGGGRDPAPPGKAAGTDSQHGGHRGPGPGPGGDRAAVRPPKYLRNFYATCHRPYRSWNSARAFHLFPHTPLTVLPSEAKFWAQGPDSGPLRWGRGPARSFQAAGRQRPGEQFTVVMLTYEREEVLMNSLERLNGLPYLNKAVVVWNSPKLPVRGPGVA